MRTALCVVLALMLGLPLASEATANETISAEYYYFESGNDGVLVITAPPGLPFQAWTWTGMPVAQGMTDADGQTCIVAPHQGPSPQGWWMHVLIGSEDSLAPGFGPCEPSPWWWL